MLGSHRIEVVRGRLSDERADEVLRFWSAHGALSGPAAQARLPQVVCVLLDGAGTVAGVNSVYEDAVELIGSRRFWLYRRFAPGAPVEVDAAMLNAAFDVLDEEHAATEGGPIGLCVLVDDPEVMQRNREVVWPDTDLAYAGYLPDGRQVRIRYFTDARV